MSTPPGSWTLSFSDEFTGTSLDAAKWRNNWYGEGGSMNNVGTYARNVTVSAGNLNLTLESSSAGALVHTDFTGGYKLPVGSYVEARILFPGGATCYNWPAWWASATAADGWPHSGEHDIAEVLSGQLTVNYHSDSGAHNQGTVPGTWGGAFHTYGLHRKNGSADVYWDDVLVKSYTTDDTGNPEILILNHGYSSGNPSIGAVMQVDYVRAYAPATGSNYAGTLPLAASGVLTPAASRLSVQLTGLTPSTLYQVRVRATNAGGVSAWSQPASFTTQAAPSLALSGACTLTLAPVLGPANVTADFSTVRADSAIAASGLAHGSCISTFSGDGQNVNIIKGGTAGAAWKAKLGELGPVAWRIPLAWNGGTPGSSAGGARSYGDAGAYVQAIKDIGGTPVVVVGGATNDNDVTAAAAASLVHYFNDNGGQNGGPVLRWVIGNEPDNGFGVANYINGGAGCDGFNTIAAAMRAATTQTLNIGGPALVTYATYKQGDYNTFLDTCGAQVDTVDFHAYDGNNLANYSDAMTWLRGAIAARPSTAGRVKIHCGEANYHFQYAEPDFGASKFYTSVNTVFLACALGRVIEQGGRLYQYSDNNGPLGMITPGNGNNGAPNGYRLPMPAYFGVKMWSGGNLFRAPTGSMATCSTTFTDTEVFASTGAKNVVFVNKSLTTDQSVSLALVGAAASGTYQTWQTQRGMDPNDVNGNQWKDPVLIASGTYSGGRVSFTAPYLTVTTVIVGV